MTTAERKSKVSIEEYLAYDASIEGRAEYYDGEIFDMAGGSPTHSGIAVNFSGAAFGLLEDSPCNIFSSDLRVFIPEECSFVYPDVSIVCGELELSKLDQNSILNPKVIVEVISPSSESFDRIGKFNRYATIPSLYEYVLIEQSRLQVDVFLRMPENKWLLSRYTERDQLVQLASLGIAVPMAMIYRRVDFTK
jgi:Uma2 family endonuclease